MTFIMYICLLNLKNQSLDEVVEQFKSQEV